MTSKFDREQAVSYCVDIEHNLTGKRIIEQYIETGYAPGISNAIRQIAELIRSIRELTDEKYNKEIKGLKTQLQLTEIARVHARLEADRQSQYLKNERDFLDAWLH